VFPATVMMLRGSVYVFPALKRQCIDIDSDIGALKFILSVLQKWPSQDTNIYNKQSFINRWRPNEARIWLIGEISRIFLKIGIKINGILAKNHRCKQKF
jgi:hypothetical protein